jgi:anti-sigma regulatory factor (Ser/Thr protein kinase)
MADTHELELPRAAEAGRHARRFLEAHYRGALDGGFDNAALVVSELVNNAFLHGSGRIVLRTALLDGALRVEVTDEGEGNAPGIREQQESAIGGWGLRIVDTMSLRWGAYEGTTTVWAELPLRAPGA